MSAHISKFIVLGVVFLLLSTTLFSQTPAKAESEMLEALGRIGKFGSYLGNYDEEKSTKANDDLRSLLVREGKHQNTLKYPFAKLKKEMDVVTSRDGKLRIYSWDMSTGGTMHDFDCVFQFQGQSGRVNTWACSSNRGDDVGGGSEYLHVFDVSSKTGIIYLANSRFIGDGQDHGQAIEAYRITGDELEKKPKVIKTNSGLTNLVSFAYSPFTIEKGDEGTLVSFDTRTTSFRFPVVIDEVGSGGGRVTNRYITYRFNGKYFEKVK
jgi:hypothetical protein